MLASSTGAAFVGNMALQLAKKVTVYTHGNDQIVRDIQESWAKPRSRISFDTRKIVRLELAAEGSPEIILTFDDGTQSREAFLVRLTILSKGSLWAKLTWLLRLTIRSSSLTAPSSNNSASSSGPRARSKSRRRATRRAFPVSLRQGMRRHLLGQS